MKQLLRLAALVVAAWQQICLAQVNSGSNGSDGALDFSSMTNLGYSTNIIINMADHPNGIYQYTYVFIPNNMTLSFIPNANNTPVYWLVQSNVVINGSINVSGKEGNGTIAGAGGPGGWSGGNGGSNPTPGQGPGGGGIILYTNGQTAIQGGLGAFGTQPSPPYPFSPPSGQIYGNSFLVPLVGGSGGGGGGGFGWSYGYYNPGGGGGGGGAILIAASGSLAINGSINAMGGQAGGGSGGAGSGGGIRLVATTLAGTGPVFVNGYAGNGRIRFDALQDNFAGSTVGSFTRGSQFIIFPTFGVGAQLTVTSVGGVPVSASPTGALSTPDAALSAQQNNPISVVVSCSNLPLNTQITVSVRPANGGAVSATGYNTTGTLTSSAATISIVIPRGGGLIYATAATSN